LYLDEAKLTILPRHTTIEQQILSENLTKTDIISTKSHDLEDQNEEVENFFESVSNLTKVLNSNNNDNNIKNDSHILNDEAMTKDMVIRFEKITKKHYYAHSKLYVHLYLNSIYKRIFNQNQI